MFGSAALDVVFGLVFTYLVLSLLCTAANETIAGLFAMRARFLERGIQNLLADPAGTGLAQEFYDHPLMKSLIRRTGKLTRREGLRKPSYVSSRIFSLVVLDLLGSRSSTAESGELARDSRAIGAALSSMRSSHPELEGSLGLLWEDAGFEVAAFRAGLERWFDDGMERVSGWYKKRAQLFSVLLGVAIAVGLNVDTLAVAKALWNDDTLRSAVVKQAEAFAREQPGADAGVRVKKLAELELPIGWTWTDATPGDRSDYPQAIQDFAHSSPLAKAVGLLLTATAISLGAPFWFDLLSKVARIRTSGVQPAPAEIPDG